jgi:hypothetical protein
MVPSEHAEQGFWATVIVPLYAGFSTTGSYISEYAVYQALGGLAAA